VHSSVNKHSFCHS